MGCIFRKRETGPYWIKYYVRGKALYESARSTSHEDAKQLLKLREGEAARGAPVSPKIGRLTFEEAISDLANEYRTNSRRSLRDLTTRVERHLAPFFARRRMAEITAAEVRQYVARRQSEDAANATVNRETSLLRRAFVLALQAGKLATRPHIPTLRENNVRQGFFERDQLDAVLRHLPEDRADVIRFAYETGWRKGEFLGNDKQASSPLTWRQVDLVRGEVRLDPGTTKNEEGRTFPFTAELRALLERCRRRVDRAERQFERVIPFVFVREDDGEPIREIKRAFGTACRRAGCPGRTLHDFRRSRVRDLERAGVPRAVAMKLTGHKTETVYRRYAIVSEADLRVAVERLNAIRG